TESILIDGKRIHITGQTTIDDASIDGAIIKDASIGTAQIGTIDAGVANIVNINADDITSGILTSQNDRETFDLNNGFLNINEGAISIKRPDGSVFVQKGMPNLNYNVFAHDPPFKSPDVEVYNQFYRTNKTSSVDPEIVNFYTFRHEGRY